MKEIFSRTVYRIILYKSQLIQKIHLHQFAEYVYNSSRIQFSSSVILLVNLFQLFINLLILNYL